MSKASENRSPFTQRAANINLLWATLFIEELLRNNICDFCIAPGSRSTPLTLAVAKRKDVNTYLHFDERGLGFFALGIALAKKKPVVIITTSGTAVANLYSAIIEARQSEVPLIILSADRPPELIHCGANQAIEQYAIFADYPVFFRQIPSPTLSIKPNYLLTTINQGLAKQKNSPAPIHFNLAFPEPLYPQQENIDYQQYLAPLKQWLTSSAAFTHYPANSAYSPEKTDSQLAGKKVLIIVGRLQKKSQAQAISQFAQQNNYPLLADIQSSLFPQSKQLCYYDLLLVNDGFQKQLAQADIIIQFGDKLISKRLTQFIAQFDGEYWLIQKGEQCIDPDHQLTKRFNSDACEWLSAQSKPLSVIDTNWLVKLTQYNQQINEQIIQPFLANKRLSEINIVSSLDKLLPNNSPFFIGNSMPIRLCDMFMQQNQTTVYSNRGASGIDGLLATAVGVGKATGKITTLLIGDTSFLYDLNSLALLKQLDAPFIIVVINNDGGGIFNLLPVPAQQKQDFYQLPHGLSFADICKQFSVDYYHPKELPEFKNNYQTALKNSCSLIEICVKNDQTAKQLEQLKEQIQNATF
ncbi:MAG: 2-succinyl-5-enolpyruvyl-6-hydroxy-3-cyclohexene-1-carboxylic-acid synthase [Psychromonas sp.]|nr:2-succinyl-5-enolpyruvyl-6-hydroxy-3-cyclohexene-1-carboxylic-acid synthase [Psychromonas sp.]